jgi:hypothetical protein
MFQETKTRKRQEIWEEEYRANPYLAGKPLSYLIERFCYLFESQATLTESGQLGFEVEKRLAIWHLSRLTHLFMEFGARGGVPAGIQPKLPKLTHPDAPAGVTAYRSRKRADVGQLFKFGKHRWMQLMLEQGSIRFAPASSYRDASLNAAIQDDELGFTYYPSKSGPSMTKLAQPAGADWVHMRHPSDFYVQCLSLRFAPRLFDDFEADSCLIIYDAKEFGRRLLAALQSKFPDWFVTAFGMTYIDPDNPGDEPILMPMAKHMKYIYQQEQRILCHPRTPVQRLKTVDVEIGALTDIAEIVTVLGPTRATLNK